MQSCRWCSHCTSASNWELPLCCHPTLQGTSSLTKSWENTYDFHIATKAMTYTMHVLGWKCLRVICLAERFLTWKRNDNGWWESPGRYGSLAILNVIISLMRTYLWTPCQIYYTGILVWEWDHTKVERKNCLSFGWECSVANEFVARNDSRIHIFGHFWAYIFVCNTACL